MVREGCRSEVELTYIDKNYVAHKTCGNCRGVSHQKLEIGPIFDNLRVGNMDEQFQLLTKKGVNPYIYVDDWEKFKENHTLQQHIPHSTVSSTCWELVSTTMAMPRGFGESLE